MADVAGKSIILSVFLIAFSLMRGRPCPRRCRPPPWGSRSRHTWAAVSSWAPGAFGVLIASGSGPRLVKFGVLALIEQCLVIMHRAGVRG